MKKTYAFKPLCLLVVIFDFILSISLWRIFSMSSDIFSLMSSLSGLFNTIIFFMVGILGTIIVTVLLYLYYLKKEKVQSLLWDAILHTVISVYFVVQLVGLGDSLQNLTGSDVIVTIMGIIVFASALLHVFIMLRLDGLVKVTTLDAYLPAGNGEVFQNETLHQTQDNVSETTTNDEAKTSQTPTEPVITKEKTVAFFKTKNGKIVFGVIAAIIVIFAGYKIWDTFFNKIEIDAFQNMVLSYDGYNGAGEAYIEEYNIDYDMTNENLASFVNTISFDIENNGQLSNGDKVTVRANYSQETAKQLKVVLKEETKEFDVSGLTVKYQSASEIDQDIYKKAYDEAISEATNTYNGDQTQRQFYKAYYIKENSEQITYQRNYLVFVFQETYQDYDFSSHQYVDSTRYMYYYTNFDSSYDPDSDYMGQSRLYTDSFEYVENADDVQSALQNSSIADYGQATIEEVNISVS